ncbi:MAG: nucleoside deaminase [Caldilineaceae bacterium]|nr:nucleoside deaminase [Caldilineaceae bacterium]
MNETQPVGKETERNLGQEIIDAVHEIQAGGGHRFQVAMPNKLKTESPMSTELLSPKLAAMDLEYFMRAALQEAEAAGMANELPIGAVVVIHGEIVSRGRAEHQLRQNQIRHAELNAILAGGPALWSDYEDAILFTTMEPCPMCLGAAVMADIPHIVFAAHDAVVHSRTTVYTNPYIQRHIQTYCGGVLETETQALIARFNPDLLQYTQTGKD